MRIRTYWIFTIAAALLLPKSGLSQTRGCSTIEVRSSPTMGQYLDFARAFNVVHHERGSPSRFLRHLGEPEKLCAPSRQWADSATDRGWKVLPLAVSVQYNSAFPRSVNDGSAWNGVGLNVKGAAGVEVKWRALTASLQPAASYNQNADFSFTRSTSSTRSEFANPYQPEIDFPERFGVDPITTIDWGQSFLEARWRAYSIRLSQENIWVGPASVYPIILSSTAPGFPHLALGTSQPVSLGFASLEFQLVMGGLDESDYFDGISENDKRFFSVGFVSLQPHFLPGLHLGVVRAYHDSIGNDVDVGFYLKNLIKNPFTYQSGVAEGNSIGAAYATWVLPESGFSVYAEWAREDAFGDLDDLLREPDWTQAYVLGFDKVFPKPNRLARLYGELVHLGASAPERGGRGHFSYYTHGTIRQGHTHKGQLLGAAIGPGSDAQLLGFETLSPTGGYAVRIERTRYDDDTYYRRFSRRYGQGRHDMELSVSVGAMRRIRDFKLEGSLEINRRYDRRFISLEGTGAPMAETNFGTTIGVSWLPKF